MIGLHPDCPSDISLLADHLDAALAVGEEMLACSLPPRSDLDELDPDGAPGAIDDFVRRLMQLEAALLLRILRARRLCTAIGRTETSLKSASDLFRAQTGLLHDLIATAGEGGDSGLKRAGDTHAYLRSRGMIAPEAAAPSPFEGLFVSEAFRVGGVAPVGQMLDLVSALLDLLDAHYGLYSPEAEDDELPTTVVDMCDGGSTEDATVARDDVDADDAVQDRGLRSEGGNIETASTRDADGMPRKPAEARIANPLGAQTAPHLQGASENI